MPSSARNVQRAPGSLLAAMAKQEGWILGRECRSHLRGAIGPELVEPGEGGHLVTLGERRIVEDVVDKISHGARERHHGLPDVHQLSRTLTDDVDAQQLARLLVEEELEPP